MPLCERPNAADEERTNIGISMKAWGATLDPKGDSGVRLQGKVFMCAGHKLLKECDQQIRFLGDPSTAFTKELDLILDGAAIFGGDRSKRYVLKVEDGTVKESFVEPDGTGVNGLSRSRERM